MNCCFFTERMRLPPGSLHRGNHDYCLLHVRHAMVRGLHSSGNQPRQIIDIAIGLLRARRKTKISRDSRTTTDSYCCLPPDRGLGFHGTNVGQHPNAGSVRSVLVYGSGLLEWAPDVWPDLLVLHAKEVSGEIGNANFKYHNKLIIDFQPDLPYLRRVPLSKVHMFTLIQIASLVGLWIIKDIDTISILFPIMVSLKLLHYLWQIH